MSHVTRKRVKVELAEQMETTPEMNDRPNEYNDTRRQGYLINEYKDDTENYPDCDPGCLSDIMNEPATGKNSGEAADCDGGNAELRISDDGAKKWKCQSCGYRCRIQMALRCHVTKKHHAEASRNGNHMCMECGQVEDTIEALQEHKEVGLLFISFPPSLHPSLPPSLPPSLIMITSRVPVEGKSSVCAISMKCRKMILIIIIISLGQILLSYIANTSRTHACMQAHTCTHAFVHTDSPTHHNHRSGCRCSMRSTMNEVNAPFSPVPLAMNGHSVLHSNKQSHMRRSIRDSFGYFSRIKNF